MAQQQPQQQRIAQQIQLEMWRRQQERLTRSACTSGVHADFDRLMAIGSGAPPTHLAPLPSPDSAPRRSPPAAAAAAQEARQPLSKNPVHLTSWREPAGTEHSSLSPIDALRLLHALVTDGHTFDVLPEYGPLLLQLNQRLMQVAAAAAVAGAAAPVGVAAGTAAAAVAGLSSEACAQPVAASAAGMTMDAPAAAAIVAALAAEAQAAAVAPWFWPGHERSVGMKAVAAPGQLATADDAAGAALSHPAGPPSSTTLQASSHHQVPAHAPASAQVGRPLFPFGDALWCYPMEFTPSACPPMQEACTLWSD